MQDFSYFIHYVPILHQIYQHKISTKFNAAAINRCGVLSISYRFLYYAISK